MTRPLTATERTPLMLQDNREKLKRSRLTVPHSVRVRQQPFTAGLVRIHVWLCDECALLHPSVDVEDIDSIRLG